MQDILYLWVSGVLVEYTFVNREWINGILYVIILWIFVGISIIAERRSARLRAKELNQRLGKLSKVWQRFVDYSSLMLVALIIDLAIIITNLVPNYGKCYTFILCVLGCLLREAISMVRNYRAYGSPAANIPRLMKSLRKLNLEEMHKIEESLKKIAEEKESNHEKKEE